MDRKNVKLSYKEGRGHKMAHKHKLAQNLPLYDRPCMTAKERILRSVTNRDCLLLKTQISVTMIHQITFIIERSIQPHDSKKSRRKNSLN